MKLGVNIDHVATLRQARGTTYPSVVEAAALAEDAGADSITLHLREDRRHIQDADVCALRKSLRTPMNLEMAVSPEIVEIALDVVPDEACLVPERREERTTEGGLDCAANFETLQSVIARLAEKNIRVSLFIAPDIAQVDAAKKLGAPVIELHTGTYCEHESEAELSRLIAAAQHAHNLGLQVNAGHGLNLSNVASMRRVPHLDTLNIGHSIVARAVFVGLANAVREMKEKIN